MFNHPVARNRENAEAFLVRQNAVLESIATRAPLRDVLDEIVRILESQIPNTVGSVLLLDPEGQHLHVASARNLPADYNAAIDGVEIGEGQGSCGTAAHRREAVFVDDIATHPLWSKYRDFALSRGLRSCWSTPIFSRARNRDRKTVLGTFAIYGPEPGAPSPFFIELMERAEYLACIAIESDRATRALRDSEHRFRTFVDHATDGFFLHASDGTILDVNTRACETLGLSRDELIGRSPTDIDPDITLTELSALQARLETGETAIFESRHRRKDGSTFPIELRIRRFFEGGRCYDVALVQDITERRRAEKALRFSEEMLRRAQSIARMRSWSIDVANGPVSARDAYRDMLTPDSATRSDVETAPVLDPADESRVQAAWSATLAGAPYEVEHRVTIDGQDHWVYVRAEPDTDASGRVVQITGFTQDITERKRLEEQFLQAQKMDAIGRLAGGIAHDFNNLLTVINGYAAMGIEGLTPADPLWTFLSTIHDAGERAASLTRQLLAFSRKQLLQPSVTNLNDLVQELSKMLKRLIGENIELVVSLDPDLPRVFVDPGQFEQVLMNLAVNARDSMPDGGRLTVETCGTGSGPPEVPATGTHENGRYVRLTVRDTGHGMDDATRARIVEPFFTTKRMGQGTGLGLAVVDGIVRQSGGHLSIHSDLNSGTTISIQLPATSEPVPPPAPRAKAEPRTSTGSEAILLVDDDDGVRALTASVLRSRGYDLIEAADGETALRLAAERTTPIHLLLTDVVMPKMSGRELADHLTRTHPSLKVLFLSGYTADIVGHHGVLKREAFLEKPFGATALADKVRDVLDETVISESRETDE